MRAALLAVVLSGCAYPEFQFAGDAALALADTAVAAEETSIVVDSTVDDTAAARDTFAADTFVRMADTADKADTWMRDTAVVDTFVVDSAPTYVTLAPRGGVWRFLDNGAAPSSTTWRGGGGFDDSMWKSGPAQLGYGDGDEKTLVSRAFMDAGPDAAPIGSVTTYFRRFFTVTNAADFDQLTIRILRDDGAIVYLNGVEVVRTNMPSGTISSSTWASSTVSGAEEDTFYTYTIPATALRDGSNVVAVEVHQDRPESSDISFDLEIVGRKP